MNMKRLLTFVAFFATLQASAQQVNPVPDYVFANRMSAGRNTVTDTAAYFSIGPRYGATRGMMPPMVVDTASFSANKRNGLLIFSVQKNKFLYWDSVGVKWAEMAGTGGSAITGSGVAGYMPEFTTTTNLDTTRLYHSAGRFAIGSTTTTNGVFNVYGGQTYFDTSVKIGSSFATFDESKNELYINRSVDSGDYDIQTNKGIYIHNGDLRIGYYPSNSSGLGVIQAYGTIRSSTNIFVGDTSGNNSGGISEASSTSKSIILRADPASVGANSYIAFNVDGASEKMRLTSGGALGINTTSPTGYFQIQGAQQNAVQTLARFAANNASAQIKAVDMQLNAGTNSLIFNTAYAGTAVDIAFFSAGVETIRFTGNSEVLVNNGSDLGDYKLQVNGNAIVSSAFTTGAPSGGSQKPWKLGEAATVSPTSPNRTIRVEIDGTVYYLHAKTTND